MKSNTYRVTQDILCQKYYRWGLKMMNFGFLKSSAKTDFR